MKLNSLFDLDESGFSMGRGGTFRRIKENSSKPLNLSDLIQGLQAPTVPTNVPTVNPLDAATKQLVANFPASRQSTASQIASILGLGFGASARDTALAYNALIDPAYSTRLFNAPSYLPNVQKQAMSTAGSIAQSFYSNYANNIKAPTDKYNAEVAAYNAVVDPYKKQVADYNAEVQRRASNVNEGLINPDRVTKQAQESTGDVLAESDLYSDDLHNMMIDRISTQPIIDKMSAMFSPQSGGSK